MFLFIIPGILFLFNYNILYWNKWKASQNSVQNCKTALLPEAGKVNKYALLGLK